MASYRNLMWTQNQTREARAFVRAPNFWSTDGVSSVAVSASLLQGWVFGPRATVWIAVAPLGKSVHPYRTGKKQMSVLACWQFPSAKNKKKGFKPCMMCSAGLTTVANLLPLTTSGGRIKGEQCSLLCRSGRTTLGWESLESSQHACTPWCAPVPARHVGCISLQSAWVEPSLAAVIKNYFGPSLDQSSWLNLLSTENSTIWKFWLMINFRLNYLSLPRAAERNSLGAQLTRSATRQERNVSMAMSVQYRQIKTDMHLLSTVMLMHYPPWVEYFIKCMLNIIE